MVCWPQVRSSCSRGDGFDASEDLIFAAEVRHGSNKGLLWNVLDSQYYKESKAVNDGGYSKVLSNSALHWILRDAWTRLSVFRSAYRALQPSGTFVFGMGGVGIVADVHIVLLASGCMENAREVGPWLFPSRRLMQHMLEEAGSRVKKMKLEYRPAKLTAEKEGGRKGGYTWWERNLWKFCPGMRRKKLWPGRCLMCSRQSLAMKKMRVRGLRTWGWRCLRGNDRMWSRSSSTAAL